MKKVLTVFCLSVITVCLVHGQEQSGIPARVTAVNGKEFPVFLQGVEGDKMVFQLYKRPTNQNAPMKAIAKIEFVGQIDIAGAEQLFSTGDYQGMLLKLKGELKPSLDTYWGFMAIENNLQDLFVMVMKAYLRMGDVPNANKAATILLQHPDNDVKGQAESMAVLAALGDNRIEDAEAMLADIKSEPGKLYLGACIQQAKGQIGEAFKMTNRVISDFGNDLGWMPQVELLNARLYLDAGLTNSAANTARQVMNIYKNSDVGNDAAKLHGELVLAMQEYDAAVKAREDAEAAARAEIKARAAERAKGYGFGSGEESDSEEAADEGGMEPAVEEDGMQPVAEEDGGGEESGEL